MQGNELEEIILPELETLGFECVKLEVVGSSRAPVVRLYIDKPGGVMVKDCALVSRTISLLLEEKDPFPGKYLLEVSSPGSNRPLVTAEHYQRFAGSAARIQVTDPAGEKVTHTGDIVSCVDDEVTLATEGGNVTIPLVSVVKAQLVGQEYKIDKKMKKEKRSRKKR